MIRKVASDADKYYKNHFVMLHDLLRDLAVHQSKQVPFEERSRLIVDLSENDHPKRGPEQQQQGVIGRMLSIFPRWWTQQKQQQVIARTLSIYAGLSLSLFLSPCVNYLSLHTTHN